MAKKIGIVFGVLVFLFLAAAIALPFMVDVDQYRPKLVQAVNDRIDGKFDLGKLKLSLWGQIRIDIASLSLKDTKDQPVLSVKDAYFHLPFFSIFSGSPRLILKLNQPDLKIYREKNGKFNILNIIGSHSQSAQSTNTQAPSTESSGQPLALPGIVARARLGVELLNANVFYQDDTMDLKTTIKDLNFILRNLSLTSSMEVELSANFNTSMSKTLSIQGPAKLVGHATPHVERGEFQEITAELSLNLDKLEIKEQGVFEKSSSIPAHLDFKLKASPRIAEIKNARLVFHNAEMAISAVVAGLDQATPSLQVALKSNDFSLSPWSSLLPQTQGLDLSGVASVSATVEGPVSKMGYRAEVDVRGLSVKTPSLKAKPEFDLLLKLATDRIENLKMTMKAPGNDLTLTGSVYSFNEPQVKIHLNSSGLDLDQLVQFAEEPTEANNTLGSKKSVGSTQASGSSVEDYDQLLDTLRKNKTLSKAQIQFTSDLGFLQVKGMKLEKIVARANFKNLVGSVDTLSMKLWTGTIQMGGKTDLKPEQPLYQFNTKISGVDLRQAVTAQMPIFKNTLLGRLTLNFDGTGKSFNPEPAKKNLSAKGKFEALDATFATIDISKMAGEAVARAMDGLQGKFPGIKNKNVASKVKVDKRSKYQKISSDFSIQGGKFVAPNFKTVALKDQGIDLSGATQFGLVDYALDARWEVIDTYDLLNVRGVSLNVAGTEIPHALCENKGPFKFPVQVHGNLFQPKYGYGEVVTYLGKVVAKNSTGAVKAKVKEEVKEKVGAEVKKILGGGDSKSNPLKGLGKKLFKN